MSIGHNGGPPLDGNNGWIAIARSMRGHPIVGFHLFAKPCDPEKGALQPALAFIDLIMECRYDGGFVMNGGKKMEIQRGQLVGAVSWLAARWNWTPKAVRIWLDKLEDDCMISRFVPQSPNEGKHNGKVATIISICNYDKYQSSENTEWRAEGQMKDKQGANEGQQYKDKQRNKETREDISPPIEPELFAQEEQKKPRVRNAQKEMDPDFVTFWGIYPKREGKLKAEQEFMLKKRMVGAAALIDGARRYAGVRAGQDPKFTAMPATWLHQGRWDDEPASTAVAASVAVGSGEGSVGPNGNVWGWWRKYAGRTFGAESSLKMLADSKPNGTWPWWELGPPPGDPDCLIDKEVVEKQGLDRIYKGQLIHE